MPSLKIPQTQMHLKVLRVKDEFLLRPYPEAHLQICLGSDPSLAEFFGPFTNPELGWFIQATPCLVFSQRCPSSIIHHPSSYESLESSFHNLLYGYPTKSPGVQVFFKTSGMPLVTRGVEKDPAAAAAAVMADAAALAVMPTGAVSRVPDCLVSIGGRFLPSFIEIRCFFGDELLPRYGGDYFINSYKDLVMNQPSIMESRRFFCGSLDASDIWLKAVEVVGVCFWGVKTVSQDAIVTIRIRFSVEDLLFKSLGGGPKVYPFTIGYPTIFKVSNYLMQVISPGRILNHQQFRMARSRDDHPVSDGYLKILGILPKLLKTNLGFELGKITWQDAVFAKLEWGIKKTEASSHEGIPASCTG